MSDNNIPIVYSCSGCSNLAQLAHDIALNMERDGIAEMSCISGVIGGVEPIKKLAESGRPIFVVDGCSLTCTKACLDACGLKAALYFDLSLFGFEKRSKEDCSFNESCIALKRVYDDLHKAGYSIRSKVS
ncbi:putative zinc-binding protein [Aliikangiella sp. IMCC44359]|uniref:putative zinc-binding protein n=1 Tax=Aliikangiella sp. IMCC44359 TaxID=3459125 RepID=UPI00403ADFC5